MPSKLNIYKRWSRNRDYALLSLLEFNSKAVVGDLGCGDGRFTLKVKEKIGSSETIGVDIYEESLKKAKEKGIMIEKADLNKKLPFEDESYDVIISNQVIEHLFYPVKFMWEIHRILKLGGYAVISTENLASWDDIFALFLGYSPFSMQFDSGLAKIGNPLSPHALVHKKERGKKRKEKYPPHVRIFTWAGLIALSKFVGFKLEQVIGNGHLFGKFGELIDQRHCRFITIKVRKG